MTESNDVQQDVQDLRHDLDVQAATQAGAQATQAAAMSGMAAAVGSGFVALIVGIFLGMAIVKANN